jgi:ATP-dependent Zn protease
MNRSIRWSFASLLAVCTAFALPAIAAAAVHFTHESYQAFQGQLQSSQIHAVTFNKKAHTVHVTLNDGRHMLAIYPSHDEPQLAALLQAKGVSVKVEKHKTKTKAVHHTLRYIAGGILVIVILVILMVLLVGRRRSLMRAADGKDSQAEGAAPPAAPGSAGGSPGAG